MLIHSYVYKFIRKMRRSEDTQGIDTGETGSYCIITTNTSHNLYTIKRSATVVTDETTKVRQNAFTSWLVAFVRSFYPITLPNQSYFLVISTRSTYTREHVVHLYTWHRLRTPLDVVLVAISR